MSAAHPLLTIQAMQMRSERIDRIIVEAERVGTRNLYLVVEHATTRSPVIPGWFRFGLVGSDPYATLYMRRCRWWSRADRDEWRRRVRPILRRAS